jgi:hypothetical protein
LKKLNNQQGAKAPNHYERKYNGKQRTNSRQ